MWQAASLNGVSVGAGQWFGPEDWLRWSAYPLGAVCRDHA